MQPKKIALDPRSCCIACIICEEQKKKKEIYSKLDTLSTKKKKRTFDHLQLGLQTKHHSRYRNKSKGIIDMPEFEVEAL